jgi:hypothetical protein
MVHFKQFRIFGSISLRTMQIKMLTLESVGGKKNTRTIEMLLRLKLLDDIILQISVSDASIFFLQFQRIGSSY